VYVSQVKRNGSKYMCDFLVEVEQDNYVRCDNADECENRSFLHQIEATAVKSEFAAALQLMQVELIRILSSWNVSQTCNYVTQAH